MGWSEQDHIEREHELWKAETQRWLQDVRAWRADREQELEQLRRLVRWMEERERVLAGHEDSIGAHRDAVMAHELALEERRQGEADDDDGWSSPLHRRIALTHEAERARHLALGTLHKAAVAQLQRLLLMMDPERQPPVPRTRRGGAPARFVSDKR